MSHPIRQDPDDPEYLKGYIESQTEIINDLITERKQLLAALNSIREAHKFNTPAMLPHDIYSKCDTAIALTEQQLTTSERLGDDDLILVPRKYVVSACYLAKKAKANRTYDGLSASKYLPAHTAPQPAASDTRNLLQGADLSNLYMFVMHCTDDDANGHSLSKQECQRLCELGVIRHIGFGRYTPTSVGMFLFETHFEQNPSLPLRTDAEHNEISKRAMLASVKEAV